MWTDNGRVGMKLTSDYFKHTFTLVVTLQVPAFSFRGSHGLILNDFLGGFRQTLNPLSKAANLTRYSLQAATIVSQVFLT